MKSLLWLICMAGILLSACSAGSVDEKYPLKPIKIIAAATPGGGWDLTARGVQKALVKEHIVKVPIKAIDMPGAGGETGWKYVKEHGPNVLTINSSLLFTNYLLGRSDLTYKDFTPIAILEKEWETVAVPKDSPFKNVKALMNQLRADPKSLRIAVAPDLGNDDQIAFVQAAKTYGVKVSKLNFVVYQSGGDEVTALLNHYVDLATMSVSEAKKPYLKGKVEMLAVSSPKPLDGLKGVPTWKEQGVNVVFPHWRGIMGPPNMTEQEIAYWDKKLGEMVQTDTWKRVLNNHEWQPFYKNSSEAEKFLARQNEQYAKLVNAAALRDIGQ
ncbi:MAG TPA: tripartite tricarboxylate transporter substrate-binding protein [Bacillales bacterium]|nr:tripartite tricarboxylate transporter substrate-binding protein [Bacillales bacterium]